MNIQDRTGKIFMNFFTHFWGNQYPDADLLEVSNYGLIDQSDSAMTFRALSTLSWMSANLVIPTMLRIFL